ncbi:MAG TPA: DUF998 domain-containing protein [Anaerolineales bacterium]|nr:DUF998 domain-containing protein [Anaerolineales bacterium]
MGFDFLPAIFIGGILFVIVCLLAGYLTPGYSHTQQSISELGESSAVCGWLVRWVGFVPLGLSFIVFANQTIYLFSTYMPIVFFVLIGLAILIAGIFPTDPDNRRDTTSGKMHASAVITLLLFLSAAPFMFSIPAIYENPPSGWFLIFSFLMGMLTLTFLVFSLKGLFKRLISPLHEMLGFQQRLLLLLHYIWWFVFSRILAEDHTLLS